jgi:phenylalanyl-tRNA synthetase beta chain
MKISTAWLNDYVAIEAIPPTELANALTNAGLEVEGGVEEHGLKFRDVVVAYVESIEPHPNADKLRLVNINAGQYGKHKVVCGAPNVREGLYIAFALDGATVYSYKKNEWFTLSSAVIRGVESAGMVCSVEELALSQQYPEAAEGIWEMNALVDETHIGQPLEIALALETNRDAILETAPTANRGDWMSYLGVARELAALHGKHITLPKTLTAPPEAQPLAGDLSVIISNEALCPFYTGAYLKGVKVAPSPEWLRQRLEASGVRSINNVVDVTNYVMLETGQPLHAFDAQKLGKGCISVRTAKAGETLVCLDEATYTLNEETVLITHNDAPVALAGVMGGSSTAIDETSTELFLEAAYFPSASTRKSARSVGIRTESSARFERGVDAGGVQAAFHRAIFLLQELAEASLESMTEAGTPQCKEAVIELRLNRLKQIIGQPFSGETVTQCLHALGFGVEANGDEVFKVKVPSFRQRDVQQEIDLIEEVVRIYGYNNIEGRYPASHSPVPSSLRQRLLKRIRQSLMGLGLNEAMTNSLIGASLIERTASEFNPTFAVELSNSHSSDHTLMRQSVLPTLLDACLYNVQQGVARFNAFELGRVYLKRGKASLKQTGVQEALKLAIVLCEQEAAPHWQASVKTDVYRLKGILESVLTGLNLQNAVAFESLPEAPAIFHPGRCTQAVLVDKKKPLAQLGELHPALQKQFKLKAPLYLLELDADLLLKTLEQRVNAAANTLPSPVELSPYPSTQRDMAVLVPTTLPHQRIMDEIRTLEAPHLQQVELFDAFTGDALGEGNRSLAYRFTWQAPDRTMQDDEVDATMSRIRQHLQDSLSLTLR